MKHIKMILKFGLMLLLGGGVGYLVGYTSGSIDYTNIKDLASSVHNFILDHGVWFQIASIIVILGPAFIFTKKGVKIVRSKAYDEDEGELELLAEKKINIGSFLSQLHFIVAMIIFATTVNADNKYVLVSVGIFLVGIMIFAVLQVWVVNVVKSVDELKEGDPSSFKFQSQWMNSLDEGEKFRVYEAGYKAFSVSNIIMLIAMLITTLAKILFDTSIMTLILVGVMWSVQTAAYTIYSTKKIVKE